MIETIMQIFGMTMCGTILACIVWTFCTYIAEDIKIEFKIVSTLRASDEINLVF